MASAQAFAKEEHVQQKRIHLETGLKTIYGLFVRIHLEIPGHFSIL